MYKIYIFMQYAPDSYEFFQSIFGLRADFNSPYCAHRASILHTVWAVAMIMGGDVACAEIARSSNTELNIRTSIRYDRSLVTLNPVYT